MKCSFCKKTIPKGTGKQYIKKDGKILDFCSSKCEKNLLKLKRKARETLWTGEAQQLKKEGKSTQKSKKASGAKAEAKSSKNQKEE